MKLLHECVRDVMLDIETNLIDGDTVLSDDIFNRINKYSLDDIDYTCKKLSEAGFINITKFMIGQIMVNNMTYNGHQFLDTIRDNGIWKATKSKISKITGVSLPIIQQVATSIITKQLGI